MSGKLLDIKVMRTLIKREFYEQRALFVYMPLGVTLLLALVLVAKFMSSWQHGVLWEGLSVSSDSFVMGLEAQDKSASMMDFAALSEWSRSAAMSVVYGTTARLLLTFYWLGMLFYFLTTLYQSRKDKSILFWNSMPVSDAQTVVSKLLAGMIFCPAVFLGSLLLLNACLLLGLVIYGSFYDINVWQTFVVPSHLFKLSLTIVVETVSNLLWALPVYAWLLLISARARSIPFAWAAGPFGIAIGIEHYFSKGHQIVRTLSHHFLPQGLMLGINGNLRLPRRPLFAADPDSPLFRITNFQLLDVTLGVVLGLALIYAAIRFNRAEEN